MIYISTRNKTIKITASEAILCGLAPDGGLCVPEAIPQDVFGESELMGMSQTEVTVRVLSAFFDDFPQDELAEIVKYGYGGRFPSPDLTPTVRLGGEYILELYHGPTCAFKDMALCLLPGLMSASGRRAGSGGNVLILTATSGDTGKAALSAFSEAPHTGIIVFYPERGVSDIQRLQMATQEGGNVCVCAVKGSFDDAQRGVKDALSKLRSGKVRLSSANSINIGRLVPQTAYYFKAYADLARRGAIRFGERVNFCVPTGNFGNILAGYLAKRMGLPVGKLICASNSNDVLTQFLSTGIYDRLRPLRATASPSMDILVSSNLERLLYFCSGDDCGLVSSLMSELAEKGRYRVPDALLEAVQGDFLCGSASDGDCFCAIREVWENERYLMDPHTAAAYTVYKRLSAAGGVSGRTVILSTASPYKFSASMLRALGHEVPENGFECMERLQAVTGVPIPRGLSELRDKKILHRDVIAPEEMCGYIKAEMEDELWAR